MTKNNNKAIQGSKSIFIELSISIIVHTHHNFCIILLSLLLLFALLFHIIALLVHYHYSAIAPLSLFHYYSAIAPLSFCYRSIIILLSLYYFAIASSFRYRSIILLSLHYTVTSLHYFASNTNHAYSDQLMNVLKPFDINHRIMVKNWISDSIHQNLEPRTLIIIKKQAFIDLFDPSNTKYITLLG